MKLIYRCFSSFRVTEHPPLTATAKLYRQSFSNQASVGPAELQALATCLGIQLKIYQLTNSELIQHHISHYGGSLTLRTIAIEENFAYMPHDTTTSSGFYDHSTNGGDPKMKHIYVNYTIRPGGMKWRHL